MPDPTPDPAPPADPSWRAVAWHAIDKLVVVALAGFALWQALGAKDVAHDAGDKAAAASVRADDAHKLASEKPRVYGPRE